MINPLLALLQAAATDTTAIDTTTAAGKIVEEIASGEASRELSALGERLLDEGVDLGGRILAAIVIFVIGRWIIRLISKLVDKILSGRNVDAGVRSFLKSMINVLLMILLIIAVIGKLGVETTSFAALLASFGVAIGLAISGNLSNFVGGIIVLLFKPYRVNDYITVDGTLGQVVAIESFHTVIRTFAGEHIYIANDTMSKAKVCNYSKKPTLRVAITLRVEYGSDLKKVENILQDLAASDKRVLRDPAPCVVLDELAETAVLVTYRIWTKKEDYWDVYYDMNRRIYDTFNNEKIRFALPQLKVHKAEA